MVCMCGLVLLFLYRAAEAAVVLGCHHLFQGLELKDRKQTSCWSDAQLV